MWRAAFLPCPTPTVTVRSLGTMSPPANTPGAAGHQRRRDPHGAVALELHAGHLAQEGGVGLLAQRQDHRVRRERLEPPGRLREAGLVQLHRLDLQLRAVEGRDRPQPVDPHALALGVLGLLERARASARGCAGRRSAPRRRPAGGRRGPRPSRCSRRRRPRRGARSPAARRTPRCAGTTPRPRSAPRRGPGCRPAWTGARRPRRRRRRSRPPAARPRGPRPGGRRSIRTPSAAIRLNLAAEHVARHPVRRDAVAHHPAGLGARVADLDLVAEPGQMVGGRQPARPGADHEHPLAAARGRRVELPALLERQIAEEALDRVDRDGAVELGAVADALARVVADAPVDRGQRIVGDQLAPRLLVAAGRACARARPGCSRPPGSPRCRAAADRRRPVGAPGPARRERARAADRAAALRRASDRSCQAPRSDGHGIRLSLARRGRRPRARCLARAPRRDESRRR